MHFSVQVQPRDIDRDLLVDPSGYVLISFFHLTGSNARSDPKLTLHQLFSVSVVESSAKSLLIQYLLCAGQEQRAIFVRSNNKSKGCKLYI